LPKQHRQIHAPFPNLGHFVAILQQPTALRRLLTSWMSISHILVDSRELYHCQFSRSGDRPVARGTPACALGQVCLLAAAVAIPAGLRQQVASLHQVPACNHRAGCAGQSIRTASRTHRVFTLSRCAAENDDAATFEARGAVLLFRCQSASLSDESPLYLPYQRDAARFDCGGNFIEMLPSFQDTTIRLPKCTVPLPNARLRPHFRRVPGNTW
jgi:hypothetical protein